MGRTYKMLFIENYDAKSLDRSSVSMIDKYNGRLNIVGMLLTRLSALIDNLLSLIRDIRNTLGQCKQRVYDNLNQVKEVISGNDITGTESTITAIETALAEGDAAIAQAEARLGGVQQEINCNESGTPTQPVNEDCGENCNEKAETGNEDKGCSYCSYSYHSEGGVGWGEMTTDCSVCSHEGCSVNVHCSEAGQNAGPVSGCSQSCNHSIDYDPSCNEQVSHEQKCDETTCYHSGSEVVEPGCNFACAHSTDCHESPMPENCTYTCADGNGCAYEGDDCSYGTVCGQGESCNQAECDQYDCGQPCGETCHMSDSGDDSDGSEGSCGESSCGDCGQQGCDETGTEQGCAEGSCGEGSCGML